VTLSPAGAVSALAGLEHMPCCTGMAIGSIPTKDRFIWPVRRLEMSVGANQASASGHSVLGLQFHFELHRVSSSDGPSAMRTSTHEPALSGSRGGTSTCHCGAIGFCCLDRRLGRNSSLRCKHSWLTINEHPPISAISRSLTIARMLRKRILSSQERLQGTSKNLSMTWIQRKRILSLWERLQSRQGLAIRHDRRDESRSHRRASF